MAKQGGLGKGLGALLGGPKPVGDALSAEKAHKVAISMIQPNRYQPRTEFDESALEELKDSVKEFGVLQPLLVRKIADKSYELIAGERRLRAAKLAGLTEVPVDIREFNNEEIAQIALIENIQRENLNAMEEAKAYDRLMKEFRLTQETVAKKVGRSRSHIANFLRLLNLADQVQAYVANGALSMGQAKPLLALNNKELQLEAADYIQSRDLSARQSEQLVKKLLENPDMLHEQNVGTPSQAKPEQDVFVRDAVDKLTEMFGTQVRIQTGKKKSKLEIEFYSPEDLERIMNTMLQRQQNVKEQKMAALRQFSQTGKFTV
ncbi:putative chromosome partitioning protein ParB [Selenomonas ruminantium subsp. lactilytica TAM6421]|uniref:Putative chromosome partitioning protein ParB n=1 Tax=Selenomonas ruminantium subsp. lactilytica (strain NBRC 103574 / TAM6421) TaxID=927704 RepID=I0GUT0_SELRL|nr:ParB/RepB/Spo0J family partition protein [Selenomonas ruminantium]BAL84517.1 putative chromosome partitioning protein ParB [Selenomonas ruminantium subsp. lactilytica TAM6421]